MEQQSPPAPLEKPSLNFPASSRTHIDPYLPTGSNGSQSTSRKPFLTLTYAQSLDSKLSLAPGIQTILSGPETKAMTHYLRSKHDAILVGVGTAIADNPALNCRIEGITLDQQPRPIIVDPKARWSPGKWPDGVAECLALGYHKRGKGPWILTAQALSDVDIQSTRCVERCGGSYISVPETEGEMDWDSILNELGHRGIKSIMVEGGGRVINTLLQDKNLRFIDSVIITVAPVWLGDGGVNVSPPPLHSSDGSLQAAARSLNVSWRQFGQDVVMCGNFRQ